MVSNDFVNPEVEKRDFEMLSSAGAALSKKNYATQITTPTFE